jgi:hypothetical protein
VCSMCWLQWQASAGAECKTDSCCVVLVCRGFSWITVAAGWRLLGTQKKAGVKNIIRLLLHTVYLWEKRREGAAVSCLAARTAFGPSGRSSMGEMVIALHELLHALSIFSVLIQLCMSWW